MSSTNGWDFSKSDWKSSKPIGKSAQAFLLENCDYCIYLRIRNEDPCPIHWDYAASSERVLKFEQGPCSVCWGTGRRVVPIITPYRSSLGNPAGVNDFRTGAGYNNEWEIVGFFPRVLKPNYQDLIFHVEWNVPSDQVPTTPGRRVVKIYDITAVKATIDRYEKELSYYAADLKSQNMEYTLMQKNLPLTVGLPILKADNWHRTEYWN